MILEFKEITNPLFKEEIKNLKNKIKNIFNKKESFMEKFYRKYAFPNFTISAIFWILTGTIAVSEGFEVGFFNFLFTFSFFYFILIFFSIIVAEEKIIKEKRKVKYSLLNIINHYRNKNKNINAKKINKSIKSLNPKQKEIIEFINDNKLYLKNDKKIQYEILKAKINSCSLEEFKSKEKEINLFIENLEDVKSKEKIKSLISKKESLNKPLIEEEKLIKKEKEVNNKLII